MAKNNDVEGIKDILQVLEKNKFVKLIVENGHEMSKIRITTP